MRPLQVASWIFGLALIVAPVLGILGGPVEGWASLLREATPTILMTALQAALSTLGAFALGAPVGILIHRSLTPAARATLLSLFSMPTMITAAAVLALFSGQPWRFSLISVVFAHSVLNAPWIALQIADGFREFPRAWTETARTLGADPIALVRDFLLPFLRLKVLSAALQVFSLCWMSFTLVLLLGGGPPVSTLETEIYASFRMGGLDLSRASGLAGIQFVLGLLPSVLLFGVDRRRSHWGVASRVTDAESSGSWRGTLLALVLALPYFVLVKNALQVPGEVWRAVFGGGEFAPAFLGSLALGAMTGAITVILSTVFAVSGRRSRGIRLLAIAPSGISTLVLCTGFFLAYQRWVDFFEGSLFWIALVQAITLLPLAFRWVYPLVELEDRPRMAAARTLGASGGRAFWDVEFWKWRRTLARVFGLALVWSWGEYAVIAFFGGSREGDLLPQYLARLYSRYAFDEAQVATFALLIFTWLLLRFIISTEGKIPRAT